MKKTLVSCGVDLVTLAQIDKYRFQAASSRADFVFSCIRRRVNELENADDKARRKQRRQK